MYACGLVLWEVASRCNLAEALAVQVCSSDENAKAFGLLLLSVEVMIRDARVQKQIPRLPFEAEASPHPSLEEICELVVTKKVLHVINNQEDNQFQSISALVKKQIQKELF